MIDKNSLPGLYLDGIHDSNISNADFTLSVVLSHISKNAKAGSSYHIVLDQDYKIDTTLLNYPGNIEIILLGKQPLTISLASRGSMFTISNGVTLILGENITLKGIDTNDLPLIEVNENSKLIMNDESKITGNNNTASNYNSGGVYLNGGEFTMYGGIISRNKASKGAGVFIEKGKFIMQGGTICNNEAPQGGGVYIKTGEFIMCYEGKSKMSVSGIIKDNEAVRGGGVYLAGGVFYMYSKMIICDNKVGEHGNGVFVHAGTFIKKGGRISGSDAVNSNIVYIQCTALYRNIPAEENININSTTGQGLSTTGDPPFGE